MIRLLMDGAMTAELLIHNIGELITFDPLVQAQRWTQIKDPDLGRFKDAWLLARDGKILDFGTGHPKASTGLRIDAQGSLVLPGLVDCHTHPCFAGSRADEFAERLNGTTYQEIGKRGGGIAKTVRHTVAATIDELADTAEHHFKLFLKHGVTTLEAKSGYGLTVDAELKILRAMNLAALRTPQQIEFTCLALHAVPKGGPDKATFIQQMTDELLPQVAQENLGSWVDAFVEDGYFSKEDCRPFFEKAKQLGLKPRLHADEFTNLGGGKFAAEIGALSCDHLEYADEDSIRAMAEADTVAVLLPGTSLYSKIKFAEAKKFIAAGVPVALATDFNPGSCRLHNLPFVASLGALHCGLNLPEAIAAISWVPAKSLDCHKTKGALARGMDADFAMFDFGTAEEWLADFGQTLPHSVYVGGQNWSP